MIQKLNIEGSSYIPKIVMDPDTGVVEIQGESYHEHISEVFKPIFEWLDNYLKKNGRSITINFKMTYFNTSSARRFLEVFTLLEYYQNNKKGKVDINWYYQENDLDILESGQEYAEDLNLNFNFIAY